MLANLAALWRYRDLLRNLAARDLAIRYKGSSLGIAWSLLPPIVMAAVYTLAFRVVLRVDIEHFPLFLLSGLLPWTFFSTGLLQATGAVTDSGTLVRKVSFPRVALPLAALIAQFAQFLFSFLVVVGLALASGVGLSLALVAVVPLALMQLVFTAGLALLFATAHVFFRDTRHLLEVALQIWFWLTPIVYAIGLAPGQVRQLLWLNPMTLFVVAYQRVVLEHAWPSASLMGAIGVTSLVCFVIGMTVFTRNQARFAELV